MSIPGLGASLSNSMTSEEPPIAMAQPAPVIQAVQVIEAPESLDQATISTSYDDTSPTPEPTRYTIEQDTKDQPRKDKLCSVCEKDPGRYKCPRCSLPYCSITCLKQHKIDHPPDPPKPQVEPSLPAKPVHPNPRPGTLSAANHTPFACLQSSKELRALFAQFPDLPRQLEKIEDATHRPLDGNDDGGGRRGGYGGGMRNGYGGKGYWTQDKGWEAGIEAYRKAKKVYGKDGEGVREFGRVVSMLLEREEVGREVIDKEVEDESLRIVRQLLEQEQALHR